MPAKTFLHGIGIAGYRSFGEKLQRIGPFGAVNLFAGANNSGKSNILRFLQGHLSTAWEGTGDFVRHHFTDADKHRGAKHDIGVALALPMNTALWEQQSDAFFRILNSEYLSPYVQDGLAWFTYHGSGQDLHLDLDPKLIIRAASRLGIDLAQVVSDVAKVRVSGGPETATQLLKTANPRKMLKVPIVHTIPAVRTIAAGDPDSSSFYGGRGLINELARHDGHPPDMPELGEKFQRIQRFFRSVVGDDSAVIRIPYDRMSLAVKLNGRDLDLSALGTGIHQTIILAAVGTLIEESIVCIEEPETHLHPVLQRKLIKYLAENTTNQYFIATHSAHLLDTRSLPGCDTSIFHIRLENGCTKVTQVKTPGERWEVCANLGYRASDLVQSNCVIWVEGPSDRIYVNHWIKTMCPELMEGIHYSVMFYGGSLLSHLTVEDCDEATMEAINEFIRLPKLNRNMAVIMDRDTDSNETIKGPHKARIIEEFQSKMGVGWITDGRTIENYLAADTWSAAFKTVHPRSAAEMNEYGPFEVMRKQNKPFNKIAVAKAAITFPADFGVLDLGKRVEELVQFIQRCNPHH